MDYFNLYHVDPAEWVIIARLHFQAAAKHWYNAVIGRMTSIGWDRFAELVLTRFGQDHHELLLRQLF